MQLALHTIVSRAKMKPVHVDVSILCGKWKRAEKNIAAQCRRSVRAAIKVATPYLGKRNNLRAASQRLEASVVLASDTYIKKLNRQYRGKNKPTNVLSFPSFTGEPLEPGPVLLGDVILAFETTHREADAEKKSLYAHANHLVVHGILHLLGYDHVVEREARKMERLERLTLKGLGIANPYAGTLPATRAKSRTAPSRPVKSRSPKK